MAALNPWEWRDRNPYHATAFQILDLEPTADPATARARVAARRKRISFDAKRFPLFGELLTAAQINAAEEQLSTPETRLTAELLTHRLVPAGTDIADLSELLALAESLESAVAQDRAESAADNTDEPMPENTIPLDYTVLPRLLPSALGPDLNALR
jgi:hypothetical protein